MLLASVSVHKSAYEAGVLQRDLSIHNIVFHPESTIEHPRAMLIDWELCKYTEDLNAAPTQPGGRLVRSLFLSAHSILTRWIRGIGHFCQL
jgi:hypothetical protein